MSISDPSDNKRESNQNRAVNSNALDRPLGRPQSSALT